MLKKEFIVGSSGVGSQMDIYPAVMNKLFNTKIKVIGGYKDGASIFHAMESGEIHGRCGPQFTSIQSIRPHWITEKKITVPIVVSERRSPIFPNSPSIMEFAKDEPTRQQIRLLIVSQDLDRPVLAPPGVPAARVKQLRDAFNATMVDKAFLADVKKQRLTLDWVKGEEVAKTLAAAYAMPPAVVAAAKQMMAGK
jgi:tripartite-type tricarboxylate transporter receptor subunit TctC